MTTLLNPSSAAVPGPAWLRALARLPLPWLRAAGTALGAVLYVVAARRRAVVRRNLALCFADATPAQRRRWAWETFRHFGQAFVDRIWLWHGSAAQVAQRVRLEGDWPALAQSGPQLLFVPHFVGLDAAWTRLTQAIVRPWAGMYAPQNSPLLDAWVRAGRARFGAPQLVSRREGVRGLARALRAGAAVYLLPDMDLGAAPSVFVPFFGIPAATVTALPRLAALGPAPVRPVVARLDRHGYRVWVGPVWPDYPSGDDVADAQRMNAELQRWIAETPGQYHWLHRRFKTRPPGHAGLY
ncbi:LpxL/LpxP family acyltransferase [Tepidimonas charontis]|uniref:Lipid A biosynthesis palmitoleoyltransferase n=1 Tax=Tepidimonas charontis TaxID=2267262 RepID=A0A554XEV3_9BURK|nr:lipid A biosynthesis acyltransferase [Tepidimonas charontis]TSE34309.1 Lipid A biosynthesis palmitoleoyltransferase [Tepidimonas charontis]